ncbi:MAG TPA: LamG domain-containing protein [Planctomycetota bacterium]|nr:LamG domain-containing protein [Planctomycetota bacterium]
MGKRVSGATLFFIGLLSIAAGAVSFVPAPISSMVGYWKCDETAAPTKDSSGATNDGTWSGTVSGLTGAANTPPSTSISTGCLNFNSANAQVSIPGTAALTITGDFTVAFWMYPNADAGDYQRLVGKGAGADPASAKDRTFGVWRNPGNDHHILFQQMNNGSTVINLTTSTGGASNPGGVTPNGAWTHVACRVSGTAATIFLNGVQAASAARTGTPTGVTTDPVTFAYAGYHASFPGRLDDVRMYNSALDTEDIQILAAGCPPPQGLTATATTAPVTLNWSAPTGTQPLAGYTYTIKRGTVSGTYPTTVVTGVTGTTYVDNTVTLGTPYYYVVTAVSAAESGPSVEALAPGPITVSPTSGLFTSEAPSSTNFRITFNGDVPAGTTVSLTITSSKPTEGQVSDGGAAQPQIVHNVVGPMTAPFYVDIQVVGQPDLIDDGPQNYTVTVATASNPVGAFDSLNLPPVNLTNNDLDTAGITFGKTTGLVTSEGGLAESFAVTLTSKPASVVTVTLQNQNPGEVSLSQSALVFNQFNWNTGIVLTVTGVDDQILDFAQPFSITGTVSVQDPVLDAAYVGLAVPTLSGVNLDNEAIPPAKAAWGGSGCGLLGLEIGLPLLLLGLWRRRRSA